MWSSRDVGCAGTASAAPTATLATQLWLLVTAAATGSPSVPRPPAIPLATVKWDSQPFPLTTVKRICS